MPVTRRDFLNGMALTIAAGMTPFKQLAFADEVKLQALMSGDYYPPKLTGLRGSHDGSFESAHQLAREHFKFSSPRKVEESYDLVVVGAGISGLAAALYYRDQFGPDKKILVLDNHDDFGGHAKRNEFATKEGTLLSYGGSESLQSPRSVYSPAASEFIKRIGIELDPLEQHFLVDLYPGMGLSRGVFFDRKHFGESKLVAGDPGHQVADDIPRGKENGRSYEAFIGDFPLSKDDQTKLIELHQKPRDYLAGMAQKDKIHWLETHSYNDFLRQKVGLSELGVLFFQQQTHDFLAMGTDVAAALDAREAALPGFDALGLPPLEAEYQAEIDDPYIHHFPDGNASIARLTVRQLIPEVAPGASMSDIVLARFDYSQLDCLERNCRIRLNSTVIRAQHQRDNGPVELTYVQNGQLHKVLGNHCIMACYNMMIPYLVPEMGQAQQDALKRNVKSPLVYTKVALSNWRAFKSKGVHSVYCPSAPYCKVKLDFPSNLGGYRFPTSPDQPMVVHMIYVPTVQGEGLSPARQAVGGRAKLLEMSFADHEQMIRSQLQEMFGDAGFKQEDILGITVNRWSHGYTYIGSSLFDDWDELEKIGEIARQPFGNIHIANADSQWDAYAHAAIDAAERSVAEIRAKSQTQAS
ncbi:Conserevd hypothetical protein [gamma proteobacterium HdN1]|nr:Conserevd hypothetical protein [gamma proteobacterium HdN1]